MLTISKNQIQNFDNLKKKKKKNCLIDNSKFAINHLKVLKTARPIPSVDTKNRGKAKKISTEHSHCRCAAELYQCRPRS